MGASVIQKKRQERNQQIKALKDQIEKLEKDTMYAPDYKSQKLREFRNQIQQVKNQFDSEIPVLIKQSKNQVLKDIDQAQYSLTPEEVNKQLLMEMRNQTLAENFYSQWKGAGAGEDFVKEAEQAIENNFSNAGAYVAALKRLGHEKANQLEQQHKINTRTPLQKMHYEALAAIEGEETSYKIDVMAETNPLGAAVMTHYQQNPHKA
jgi:hexokinase